MKINENLLTAAGGLTAGHPVIVVDGIAFPVGVQGAGGGGGDLPSVSFTAKDLKKGATALNTLGAVVAGTMPETQATLSGAQVVLTSGYTSGGVATTIPNASGSLILNDSKGQVELNITSGGYLPPGAFAYLTLPSATYSMTLNDDWRRVEFNVTSGGYVSSGAYSQLSLPFAELSSTYSITVGTNNATVKMAVSNGGYLKKGDTVSTTISRGVATSSGNAVTVPEGYHVSSRFNMPGAEVVVDGAKVNVTSAGYAWVGTWATIPSAVVNVSGAIVTVTSGGYVSSGAIATIPSAEITSTTTAIRIGAGYVSSAVEFPVSYNGDAQYGVVDENGNFQPLDMTISPPVNSGTALEATYRTIATGLPYPDGEEVTPGGGGVAQLVKVTEYSPAHDDMQGVSAISVSGFGVLETYDGDIDFSAWNGTYNVTTETKFKEEEKQIFKHSSSNKYIFRMYNSDYEEYVWAFGSQPSASNLDDVEFYSNNLNSGYWSNYQYDASANLTLNKTTTDYPAQGMVLNVVPAENFTVENDIRTWSFGAPISLAAYEEQPTIGPIYAMLNGTTLSNIVYPQEIQGVNGLIFLGDMTADTPLLGTFTVSGSVTYSTSGVLLENKYLTPSIEVEDFAGDFTLIFDILLKSTGRVAVFAAFDADQRIGIDTNGGTYNIWAGNSGWNILEADSGYSNSETSGSGRGSISITPNAKQHIVFTRTGDIWELYVNGVRSLRKNRSGTIRTGGKIAFNRWGNGGYMSSAMQLSNIKMYKRGATETEKTSEE